MIEVKKDIFFSSKLEDMEFDVVFDFIKDSYWGNTRKKKEQRKAMQHSLNFGLFYQNQQIAYSRVMTDGVFFAYLLDVFVLPSFQGKGLGKVLIRNILNFNTLKDIDKWMLATRDAHELYMQFGFEIVKDPSKLMDKLSPRAKKIYE